VKKGKVSKKRNFLVAIGGALVVVFMAELLVYAWCRVQYVRTGYQITEATVENQHLKELYRKLKLEEARLRSPDRIMRIARQRGLVIPDSKQVVVIP
jgi:cell division protein FtsL